jgi:histidinol dehydrogenase
MYHFKNNRIMSKTVEIQIEKSRGLVEGLRRHVKEMGERGVTNDEINALEQAVKELEVANAEVDSLREQLTPKVKDMKIAMDRVKEAYTERKKTLKGYYPQERWMDYGVPDKR